MKFALSVVVIISPLPKALAPDVTSFKSERLMVISLVPSYIIPFIFLCAANLVAVLALPFKLPVIELLNVLTPAMVSSPVV